MSDVKGYALLKNSATGRSTHPMSDFIGHPIRVMEFGHDCILTINSEATALGDFDMKYVHSSFKCEEFGDLLIPPDLDLIAKMLYVGRVYAVPENNSRDMNFIRKMVIIQSLSKGEFCDAIYFNIARPNASRKESAGSV